MNKHHDSSALDQYLHSKRIVLPDSHYFYFNGEGNGIVLPDEVEEFDGNGCVFHINRKMEYVIKTKRAQIYNLKIIDRLGLVDTALIIEDNVLPHRVFLSGVGDY